MEIIPARLQYSATVYANQMFSVYRRFSEISSENASGIFVFEAGVFGMAPPATNSQENTLGLLQNLFRISSGSRMGTFKRCPICIFGGERRAKMSGWKRTAAGLQVVIPGCERRTLPK